MGVLVCGSLSCINHTNNMIWEEYSGVFLSAEASSSAGDRTQELMHDRQVLYL